MEKFEKILPDKNILYFMAYIIWASSSLIFGRSTLETFLGLSSVFWLKKVSYLICGILILGVISMSISFEKMSKRQLLKYLPVGLLIVVFGLNWRLIGVGTYFMQLMFIVAAKEIDLKKIPRITVAIQCVVVPLIISLALTGVIENISFMYERMDHAPVYRQSLGFQHPNALGAQIVQFCICWLWLRWEKWKWYDYLVYAVSAYFMYTICNSITSMVLIILIVGMKVIFKLLIKIGHTGLLKKLVGICIWTVPSACILLGNFYSKESQIVTAVDRIISVRFKLANRFLNQYPASLFGCKLPEGIGADNLYVHVSVQYGFVILILIICGIYRLMKYAEKKEMYPLIISIFVYILYGVTERYPFLLVFNFTLLYLSVCIWEKPGKEYDIWNG